MARYIDANMLYDDMLSGMAMTGYQSRALDIIDRQLTADVKEVKHGHWIEVENPNYSPFDDSDEHIYYCSECATESNKKTKYCSECGAIMDEKENKE